MRTDQPQRLIAASTVHAINLAHDRVARTRENLLMEYPPIMVDQMIKQLQQKELAVLDAINDLLLKYLEIDNLACAAADHPHLNNLLDQLNISHG